jgi:hypothetical protein
MKLGVRSRDWRSLSTAVIHKSVPLFMSICYPESVPASTLSSTRICEDDMDQDHLTKDQLTRLHQALYPAANLLNRLERRMSRLGFPTNDPLYLFVVKAQSAIQDLYVHVHYLSCSSGVGRPQEARQSDSRR